MTGSTLRFTELAATYGLIALVAGGCASLDLPVSGEARVDRDQRLSMTIMALRQENQQVRSELAGLRSDLSILEEGQRRLVASWQDGMQASADQTRHIQELGALVATLQTRVASADEASTKQMAQLQDKLARESKQRQEAVDAVTDAVGTQINRVVKKVNESAQTRNAKTYTVSSGDTLGMIAQAFEVPLAELKSVNGLRTDLIRVGQVLKIP